MANYLEIESVFKNGISFGYFFPILIQIKKKFIENFFWGESQTLKLKKINFNNLLKISLTNWKLMFLKFQRNVQTFGGWVLFFRVGEVWGVKIFRFWMVYSCISRVSNFFFVFWTFLGLLLLFKFSFISPTYFSISANLVRAPKSVYFRGAQ